MAKKTLAELRAQKTKLPTRSVKICLDQEVLAAIQQLAEEADALRAGAPGAKDGDGNSASRPRKGAEGANPRLAEIEQELEALRERMVENEGDLILTAIPAGEWQRWKDENPPREGNQTDEAIAYGFCNATELLDHLGRFALSFEGEWFEEGDWDDWFAERVAPADLYELVTTVIVMHEQRISVPKSLSVSSETPNGEAA